MPAAKEALTKNLSLQVDRKVSVPQAAQTYDKALPTPLAA